LGRQRGRMIPINKKQQMQQLIKEGICKGAKKSALCNVLDISIRTYQRWEKTGVSDKRKGAEKHIPRKLSDSEQQKIISTACNNKFKDDNPYSIVATLAQEGTYIASESTFYRILRKVGKVRHRTDTRKSNPRSKPKELIATGSNQVWSWDITWLPTTVRGVFLFAYMIIDIWSRKIVGWEIHEREDVDLAANLFKRLKRRLNVKGIHLRSDNGNQMKGASILSTLYELGIMPSFSRPRVSNDNPFIESFFKTVKYTPGYPGCFEDLNAGRQWMMNFVHWYNESHLHSAIGFVTPEQMHNGTAFDIFERRNDTIQIAKSAHPERWVNKIRVWKVNDTVILSPNQTKKEKAA